MFILIFVLILLIINIILGQLNNQSIDYNFFGVILHGIPLTLLLMSSILIGIILTYLTFAIKNLILMNKLDKERRSIEILSKKELLLKNKIKSLESILEKKENKNNTEDIEI